MKRMYGWVPDKQDHRDIMYGDVRPSTVVLPPKISLRDKMPPVFDQGHLSSCTANAANALWAFVHGGGPYSRLQVYYNERQINGTVDQDCGAQIRDSIKVLNTIGAGLEEHWPYIESNFAIEPPATELAEAAMDKAVVYSRLLTREDYRTCLSEGFPFIIGIMLYNEFEGDDAADTGMIPMPNQDSQFVGGHAVCVIGYDTDKNGHDMYEVRNSWGDDWGSEGNFFLPAAYLDGPLGCDAWTIRK